MNKDLLKKHHFWILVGLIPLLVLVAVVLVTSEVGAAIEEKKKAIDTAEKDLQSKSNPKPNQLLAELEKQREALEKRRTELWKENWERQIGVTGDKQDPARNLLRWPASRVLARFNYTPNYATDKDQLKFGAPIPNTEGELNEFTKVEVYTAEFSNARPGFPGTGMADRVAPTQFANGNWAAVLRHVSLPPAGPGWENRAPTSSQVWLALEDLWVQRAMLGQIRAINDQIGAFALVRPADGGGQPADPPPLDRTFASRIWQVDLKVAPRPSDGRYVITGTLANLTDRLQLLGNGNVMTLNVWLSDDPNAPPFAYKIGGEFVPGKGATRRVRQNGTEVEVPANVLPVVQTDEHVLPAGIVPQKISRVEQVFDTRTVPVRRIDRLALGYKDSRYSLAKLEPPKFWPDTPVEGDPNAGGADGYGGMPPVPARPMPAPGADGAGGGAGTGLEGGGSATTVLDGNRTRYVNLTDQVRRMPVAICVIVDQAYIQDVLLAYANCPLRFQVTQVHWQRFRGSLGRSTMDGGTGPMPSDGSDSPRISASGTEGSGVRFPGQDGGLGLRPLPGAAGRLPGFPGPMAPGSPMGPGSPAFGPGGTMTTTVTESQLTSGLVELTVYGIVSLYEKYQSPGTAGEAGADVAAADNP
jgi:hypothetical protein